MTQKCGFVAIIGAPNAGKSTLINQLVEAKVSIVTPKVQTTRTNVRGICVIDKSQIILVDTPGLFSPKKRIEKAMVSRAWDGTKEADFTVFMVDVSQKFIKENSEAIIKNFKQGQKYCLVLNKIDKIKPEKLLELSSALNGLYEFDSTFMISAKNNEGVDDLKKYLADQVPAGPWLYPEDQVSDFPDRLLAAEITREKLFLLLKQELPYGLTVETEGWEAQDNGDLRVNQVIYVTKPNHKGIILGNKGSFVKKIGTMSREDLEDIFERRVHLFLFVKVRENWAEKREYYQLWDLDYQ